MAGVRVKNICKRYEIRKEAIHALKNIDVSIENGSFTAVVGRSGCGKTTLLRIICGLEEKTAGEISFITGGAKVRDPEEVRIGIMFQEPRLMPWLTVRENISFSALTANASNEEAAERFLQMLGLEPFQDAYPHQISGGMAQRAALGRALFYNPDLILMDEPFGALDYFTRKRLQNEIAELYHAQKKTFILVTHDIEEAVYLSGQVLVMDAGSVIRQVDVDLPYPRNTSDPRFLAIRDCIYQAITG